MDSSNKKIKVLMISPCYPYPQYKDGSGNIIANLILDNEYYQMDVLSLFNNKDKEYEIHEKKSGAGFIKVNQDKKVNKLLIMLRWLFSRYPINVVYYLVYQKRIKEKIEEMEKDYQVIQFNNVNFFPVVSRLSPRIQKKILLSPVDSLTVFTLRKIKTEKSLFVKWIWLMDLVKAKRLEKHYYSRVRKVVFASHVDVDIICKFIKKVDYVLIPNGVDVDYYKTGDDLPIEKNSILFSGNMSYQPNLDTAYFIIRELAPVLIQRMPDMKIYIVGANADKSLISYNTSNIIVTGFVDDIRKYIARVNACISPLMCAGGGIKNKVIEAMAMSKIVIGSPLSFEGIPGKNQEHYIEIKSNSVSEWVNNIFNALKSYDTLKYMEKKARQLIVENFSWQRIRKEYHNLYNNFLNK